MTPKVCVLHIKRRNCFRGVHGHIAICRPVHGGAGSCGQRKTHLKARAEISETRGKAILEASFHGAISSALCSGGNMLYGEPESQGFDDLANERSSAFASQSFHLCDLDISKRFVHFRKMHESLGNSIAWFSSLIISNLAGDFTGI